MVALSPDLGAQRVPTHPTVKLRAGALVELDIDVDIAPLVRGLWDLGFWTQFSCQGTPTDPEREGQRGQDAYITFSGWDTARSVADIVGTDYSTWDVVHGDDEVDRSYLVNDGDGWLRLDVFNPIRCRSSLRWNLLWTREFSNRIVELGA